MRTFDEGRQGECDSTGHRGGDGDVRARAVAFAQELGWTVTAHADAVVLSGFVGSAGEDRVIARDEEVIEAITIDSSGISAAG
jgi:hypothetical protein